MNTRARSGHEPIDTDNTGVSEPTAGAVDGGIRPANVSRFGELYDDAISALLDVPVTDRWVETSAGRTHVLTAGDATAPPVVVFQGGNVTNPVTLAWVQELASEYYLIAPDTPRQPGWSDPHEPDEYGPWVVDVLDGLGIDRAAMAGISHGGGILLEAAVHAPDRIAAAVLVAPAGFGTSLSSALARIVVLSLAYRVVPRRGLLTRALAPMFSDPIETVDDVVIETVGQALRTGDLQASFPGPDGLADLAAFNTPTLVILSERDPFFPASRIRPRVEQTLPALVECLTLAGERHFLSTTGQERVTDQIQEVLAEQFGPDEE
ncbi:Dipeptidyl aminopeptidase/acylaminoacyl-peptidase (plasmid) [Halapricum desulfuricans]|uniref:Dipeptidyl aminopeptidase/acylaminoacyl-peptidase n=1 Tax=Halapricum desulfuricans TaxID=2841257 RepID=A0A897NLF6_9EURY|nr:alpha/beta fold hydrolase [Halapricum desulfuricans]QSG13528.1 Dipeptidyl aminopeptidase/acylaminoacyl-peptidase [Halapricum desulfuricans]